MLCHECKGNPVAYLVSASHQTLSVTPGHDQARLGVTFDGKSYLDLGNGPQAVLLLCDQCARTIPSNEKWPLTI